jgi:hypothetical protein
MANKSKSQMGTCRCEEAQSRGVAPIYRRQPGYREGVDGDGDGIAFEP